METGGDAVKRREEEKEAATIEVPMRTNDDSEANYDGKGRAQEAISQEKATRGGDEESKDSGVSSFIGGPLGWVMGKATSLKNQVKGKLFGDGGERG